MIQKLLNARLQNYSLPIRFAYTAESKPDKTQNSAVDIMHMPNFKKKSASESTVTE